MKTLHRGIAALAGLCLALAGNAVAHRAVTALNDYGRTFDHPQWQPLQ